ncbi:hypothetical protein CKAH01_15975 [Colletotrichum kahawae]|uniref:Uncharacterized protein n=1 Tax=Colletotrichum kahawae TaxID=34407 RepID=A0AAD9YHD8_COLKA|nr:hypothetical protein CKAH01_15975 [Colletotrichum kahawae]
MEALDPTRHAESVVKLPESVHQPYDDGMCGLMAAPSQAGRRPLDVALLLDNGNGQSIDMQWTSSAQLSS